MLFSKGTTLDYPISKLNVIELIFGIRNIIAKGGGMGDCRKCKSHASVRILSEVFILTKFDLKGFIL